MATTTIPWNDGSGDNITLTYPAASGNQTVLVSSDANTTGVERTKNIVFTVTEGGGGEEELDYTDYTSYSYYISPSNKWASGYSCVLIPVNPGDKLRFDKGTNAGIIAVLQTHTITSGTTPSYSTSYPSRITAIPDELVIPEDGHYLYVSTSNSGGAVTLRTFKEVPASAVLAVTQEAAEQEETISVNITSHDATDYAYASVSNITRAYSASTSTNYARINLTTGAQAVTYIYFQFGDLSSIPANATIESVVCEVKCRINQTSSSRIATRQAQMFSGTTAKGDPYTVANVTDPFTITPGTWTRAELQNARIRLYAQRGTSNATTNYYFDFYGATLTVTYKYGGRTYVSKVNAI